MSNKLEDKNSVKHHKPHRAKKKTQHIEWFAPPPCPVRGETALWTAVITQAMMDALTHANNAEALYYKNEAIHWLTSNSRDFNMVCQMAGKEPDEVRRKAKKALASPKPWRAEAGQGKRYLERKTYRQKMKTLLKKGPGGPISSTNTKPSYPLIPGPWVSA